MIFHPVAHSLARPRARGLSLAGAAFLGVSAAAVACSSTPPPEAERGVAAQSAAVTTGPHLCVVDGTGACTPSGTASVETCQLTRPNGDPALLSTPHDVAGADQGVATWDSIANRTWLFYGDTKANGCPGDPYNGSTYGCDRFAWTNGPDFSAWVDGGDPTLFCAGTSGASSALGVASVDWDSRDYPGGPVWAPDWIATNWKGDSPDNYAFQAPTDPPIGPGTLGAFATAPTPGINETPSGAVSYDGVTYLFYHGAPGTVYDSHRGVTVPFPSVSYLLSFTPQTQPAGAPTPRQVVARLDYSVGQGTSGCSGASTCGCQTGYNFNGTDCSPGAQTCQTRCSGTTDGEPDCFTTCMPPSGEHEPCASDCVPTDWSGSAAGGPLQGNFIWVTSTVQKADATNGGADTLYLYGTGSGGPGTVYAARVPMSQVVALASAAQSGRAAPYLSHQPGFQIWTTAGWQGGPHGPTAAEIATLQPAFSGTDSAKVGKPSVVYDPQTQLWLMAYATPGSSPGSVQVQLRWAAAGQGGGAGAWSAPLTLLDSGAAASKIAYCCGLDASGKSSCQGNQIADCVDDAGNPACYPGGEGCAQGTTEAHGLYDFYAPVLMPTPTNPTSTTGGGYEFTLYYDLSSFAPYGTTLFSAKLRFTP